MTDPTLLKDKRILIVDDEPDMLETLVELLDMCIIDTALDFTTAERFLLSSTYDAAIFDIMGVGGYELLKIATEKGIPTLMLTAHALSPSNLVKSLELGAHIYLPKDKMAEIDVFLADLLENAPDSNMKSGRWLGRLLPYFNEHFGAGWKAQDESFWKTLPDRFQLSCDELNAII